jgi:hypothetical protein
MESNEQRLKKRVNAFSEIDRILGLDDSIPNSRKEIYSEFEKRTKEFLQKYGKKVIKEKKTKKSDLTFINSNELKIKPKQKMLNVKSKGKTSSKPSFMKKSQNSLLSRNYKSNTKHRNNSLLFNLRNNDQNLKKSPIMEEKKIFKSRMKIKSKKKIGNSEMRIYKK